MAYPKLTPKIHRRRVDDCLVEQVYSVLKDCQIEMTGHVQASLFRGDPSNPENLIEQAETENVIMQWFIDMAQTMPLLLFNMLGTSWSMLGGDSSTWNGGFGMMAGNKYTSPWEIPGASLLYTPPNWYHRACIFTGQGFPFRYLLCSDCSTAESASGRFAALIR